LLDFSKMCSDSPCGHADPGEGYFFCPKLITAVVLNGKRSVLLSQTNQFVPWVLGRML
jgi:hypothetical protein